MAPSIATPVIAIVAIFAVHFLTKGREREKAVFDLHKVINDAAAAAKAVAITAWIEPEIEKRTLSIGQTKWKLQQLGGLIERLRLLSRRRRYRWSLPLRWPCRQESIALTGAMGALRDMVTQDPFEDPDRLSDLSMEESIEQAVGSFLQELDGALLEWMS